MIIGAPRKERPKKAGIVVFRPVGDREYYSYYDGRSFSVGQLTPGAAATLRNGLRNRTLDQHQIELRDYEYWRPYVSTLNIAEVFRLLKHNTDIKEKPNG